MGKVIYEVRNDYEHTFVKHIGGEYLTQAELRELIEELVLLDDEMSVQDAGQDAIRNQCYLDSIKHVLDSARLRYPAQDLPYISGIPNIGNRPVNAPRYVGVYVTMQDTVPDVVKIGFSTDVYQRMKALFHEYNKQPFKVIALIETEYPAEMEEYMHRQLAFCCRGGEWFDKAPVIKYIESMTRIMAVRQ